MSKRPTAIQLDRLAQAMKRFGYEPKRHELLDIAANAFGYRNSNEFTAAKLSPPIAEPIGTIEVQGSVVVLARDNVSHAIFAVEESFLMQVSAEERCETILPTPYGHLANVSRLLDDNLPDLDKEQVITTAIETQAINYPGVTYVMEVIDHDKRLYWSNQDGWVDLKSATRFPDMTGNMPMSDNEITWRTWAQANAMQSDTEDYVGVKTYGIAKQIGEILIERGQGVGATFTPQVWIGDYATECDSEGERHYDITIELIACALHQGCQTPEEYLDGLSDNDPFQTADNAPEWVHDWSGPFEVEINAPDDALTLNLVEARQNWIA